MPRALIQGHLNTGELASHYSRMKVNQEKGVSYDSVPRLLSLKTSKVIQYSLVYGKEKLC